MSMSARIASLREKAAVEERKEAEVAMKPKLEKRHHHLHSYSV